MKNKMLITAITIDNKSLFEGAKVKHKQSGKVREIFVLPEGMRISEAVDKKLLNMDTHVEYETVMLNKHLFELVDETLDEESHNTEGEWRLLVINSDVIEITLKNDWKPIVQLTTFDRSRPNSTQTFEQIQNHAERIVKCVNNEYKIDMYDELVTAIKNAQSFFDQCIKTCEEGKMVFVANDTFIIGFPEILKKIKQPEQKK